MQLKTILNYVEKHKGFVYEKASLVKGDSRRIEVTIKPRSNSKPVCDGCGNPGGTYDTQPQREFSYVPLWNIAVFLIYAPRRVNCRNCKRVVIERMPWAEGKCRMTNSYKLFLANWAKRLSRKETAEIFSTSWSSVYRSVKWCVSCSIGSKLTAFPQGQLRASTTKPNWHSKKPTDLVNLKQRKPRCIICLRDYRNQVLPTDPGEEAY